MGNGPADLPVGSTETVGAGDEDAGDLQRRGALVGRDTPIVDDVEARRSIVPHLQRRAPEKARADGDWLLADERERRRVRRLVGGGRRQPDDDAILAVVI